MALIGIVGELGMGKTLTATYLTWRNYYYKKRRVFSNINLYGIPFTKIDSIQDFEKMKKGVFLGDELWLWIDSRCSQSVKNRVTSTILLKSRKRGLTIIYTAQAFSQIDRRVRTITDFLVYPLLNRDNTICKAVIFRGSNPTPQSIIRTLYFRTEPIFKMYNSNEEVEPLKLEDDEPLKEILIPIKQNPVLKEEVQ